MFSEYSQGENFLNYFMEKTAVNTEFLNIKYISVQTVYL